MAESMQRFLLLQVVMSPLILRMKLDYAETEIGAHEVNRLLGRIDYGVYS